MVIVKCFWFLLGHDQPLYTVAECMLNFIAVAVT